MHKLWMQSKTMNPHHFTAARIAGLYSGCLNDKLLTPDELVPWEIVAKAVNEEIDRAFAAGRDKGLEEAANIALSHKVAARFDHDIHWNMACLGLNRAIESLRSTKPLTKERKVM